MEQYRGLIIFIVSVLYVIYLHYLLNGIDVIKRAVVGMSLQERKNYWCLATIFSRVFGILMSTALVIKLIMTCFSPFFVDEISYGGLISRTMFALLGIWFTIMVDLIRI